MRSLLLPIALLAASLALASCDGTTDETPTSFSGVPVTPVGGATLRAQGGALVVSGIPAGTDAGFAVPGPTSRVDVVIDPVAIPAGGRFGGRVEDAAGGEIASVFAVGLPDDRVRIVFSFGQTSSVDRVRVVYRLGGQAVLTIPELPVRGDAPFAATLLLPQNAGEGSGSGGSVHFVRDGGRWVAISDSETSPKQGCAGFLLRPPSVPGQNPVDVPVCTDWVEITPLTGTQPAATRTAILARGMDGFTVRTLSTE